MSKLGDRLREAREKMDLSQADFARLAGTKQQRIAAIEVGDVTSPRKWEMIADAAQIDREEFRQLIIESSIEAERQRVSRSAQITPFHRPVRPDARILGHVASLSRGLVPVYGRAVGGALGEYIFNGEMIATEPCPPGLENVQDAYAVYVDGDSMAPRYRAGETVYVHPTKPPHRGDDVIVQIKARVEGDPPHGYIKEFVGWTEHKLKLQQHNPARELSFARDEVVSVHTIVFSQKA